MASLAIGTGGVLYGTTSAGAGTCFPYPGCGTVFSLAPPASPGGAWTESVLHSFTLPSTPCTQEPCDGGSDGAYPTVSVAIGSGNVLYGTTAAGGSGPCDWGCGTAFQLTPPASPGGDWTETVIYSFINPNGIFSSNAGASGLAIGSGGVLYGTLVLPGPMLDNPNPCGIVFSLTPPASPGSAWTETALHTLPNDGSSGCGPNEGVVISNNGVLYGVTQSGSYNPLNAQAPPEVFSLTPQRLLAVPGPMQCYICS